MTIDPNFNIELALEEAGIPLEVFEPYRQRLGFIERAKFLQKPAEKEWLSANKEAEGLYPTIANLSQMHSDWMAQERARIRGEKEA